MKKQTCTCSHIRVKPNIRIEIRLIPILLCHIFLKPTRPAFKALRQSKELGLLTNPIDRQGKTFWRVKHLYLSMLSLLRLRLQ